MKRVVIFGATDYFYNVAMRTLNLDSVSIVAFADNNSKKWEVFFKNIIVVAPEKILDSDVDYILVGPLYSYMLIFEQLSGLGITADKILPLVDAGEVKWLPEVIDFNEQAIFDIYRNSEKMIECLQEANKVNAEYENANWPTVEKNVTDFKKYPLIAHACGGYINGEKREYTNSLESFKEAIQNKFNMIEVDVWGKENGKIIMGSRLKMQYPINIDYTIPTLNQLLDLICAEKDKKIILDIKWNTVEDYLRLLKEVEEVVEEYEKQGYKEIKQQILVEVFNEATALMTTTMGWECLLTGYRDRDGCWIKKACTICMRYNIRTMMIDAGTLFNHVKYIEYALKKKINVIVYSVDDIDLLAKARNLGCVSCLTNFLK